MVVEVLKHSVPLLLSLAAGSALVGLLVWMMAAQQAADRRWAYGMWGVSGVFALLALLQAL